MEYKKKQIKKIINFLEQGKKSSDTFNRSEQFVFVIDENIEDFKVENLILPKIPEKLNRNIQLMYQIIGNPKKEVYVNEWIILSLNDALEKYNYYVEKGQNRVFDIAYRYMGMGHIEVMSCDLETHLLYYRPDGGSNGYDCEDNFQTMLNSNPEITYQQFYFQNWIDHV